MPSYTTYAASPLGKLITKALEKIAVIKAKYPLDKHKKASKDQKDAIEMVHASETMLNILNDSIFPKFDLGKSPSLVRFIPSIPDFLKLKKILKGINAQENMLFAQVNRQLFSMINQAKAIAGVDLAASINQKLDEKKIELFKSAPKETHKELEVILTAIKSQISSLNLEASRSKDTIEIYKQIVTHLTLDILTPRHPMSYELMIAMNELITNASDNLADNITFFNPAVVTDMLANSTTIAGQLKTHTGIIAVKHLSKAISEPLSYKYTLTKQHSEKGPNGKALTYEEARDLETDYTKERNRILNEIIRPTTRRYLAKYGTTHQTEMPQAAAVIKQGLRTIQSEIAQLSTLQALATNECRSIRSLVNTLFQEAHSALSNTVALTIPELEELLHSHESMVQTLSAKKSVYESTNVDALLQQDNNADILGLFNGQKEALCDVSYAKKPLPRAMGCATVGAQSIANPIVFIKEAIFMEIDAALSAIDQQRLFIQKTIKAAQQAMEAALYEAKRKALNLDEMKQQSALANTQLNTLQEQRREFIKDLNTTQSAAALLKSESDSIANNELELELEALTTTLSSHHQSIKVISADIESMSATIDLNNRATEENTRMINLLKDISVSLNTDLEQNADKPKPKISFSAIDELIRDAHIGDALTSPKASKSKGHANFLSLIYTIAPEEITRCSTYCDRQDHPLKINPTLHQFKEMIAVLLLCMQTKTTALIKERDERSLTKTPLADELQIRQEALKRIANQCGPIEVAISRLNEIAGLETKAAHLVEQIHELSLSITDLTDHRSIVNELLDIASGIDPLNIAVNAIQQTTCVMVTPLKQAHERLTQRIIQVSVAIGLRDNATLYSINLNAIKQLLIPINIKIEQLTMDAKHSADKAKQADRHALVLAMVTELDVYCETRAVKYRTKDFFSSTDKAKRQTFIDRLKTQLMAYSESNHSEESLKLIRDHIAAFPGKGLKPLLNKITIDLIDSQEETPTTSELLTERHNQAQKSLGAFVDQKGPKYAKVMRKLYEKIGVMKQFGLELIKNHDTSGQKIIELAEKLEMDTDGFINHHNGTLPQKGQYKEFKEKFMARLHSQDNIMSERHSQWLPIIGNIALVILLIPKLIYSKLSTGQCSFFFETTKKSAFIDGIDKQARELTEAIASHAA